MIFKLLPTEGPKTKVQSWPTSSRFTLIIRFVLIIGLIYMVESGSRIIALIGHQSSSSGSELEEINFWIQMCSDNVLTQCLLYGCSCPRILQRKQFWLFRNEIFSSYTDFWIYDIICYHFRKKKRSGPEMGLGWATLRELYKFSYVYEYSYRFCTGWNRTPSLLKMLLQPTKWGL